MDFLKRLHSDRPILWNGPFGTNASRVLLEKNIRQPQCNESLNINHPEVVEQIHQEFICAGAEVIETNTFGATKLSLAEHALEKKFKAINEAAVKIARRAANHKSPLTNRGIFVAASIGPTSKLPTLGHISFDDLSNEYEAEAKIIASCGVDLFQIETCQDILQARAAIIGIKRTLGKRKIPIVATVTLEKNGATLLGSDICAAYASLAPLGIAAFGLNCATGPSEMEPQIKELARICELPIIVLPNAGLPEIKNGRAFYKLSPENFADHIEHFVRDLGVSIVGGCCGTTPQHIKAVAERISKLKNKPRKVRKHFFISSLFAATDIEQKPAPFIIGERMNVNGSKEFRASISSNKFDAAAKLAKKQASFGAHAVDLNLTFAGRDEERDMEKIAAKLSLSSPIPVMIDSTNVSAVSSALKKLSGRSIVNSINLSDGTEKASKTINLAKEFGAGLVALTIDKTGMAKSCAQKIAVAKKLISLCRKLDYFKSGGFIFIDPLTFTLAEPRAAKFGSAKETLKAIKQLSKIRHHAPEVRTILGISNVSYGFEVTARKILNSVFLHEAIKHGLDAAIIDPKQITPLHIIDKKASSLACDLIYNKNKSALENFISFFAGKKTEVLTKQTNEKSHSLSKQLFNAVVDGDTSKAKELAKIAAKKSAPEKIIESILLPAMKQIGQLFSAQKLALPFVLQSAEAMKAAIDSIAINSAGIKNNIRGKILLATVKGDVHDIGKNLVDIMLSNNGYQVIDLGIKQPVGAIVSAAKKIKPDAIGLSGLLVQSCLIMKDDLAEMSKRGISTPVICGGAALTKNFVKKELTKVYRGKVFYARDALDGLKIMQRLQRKKK